MFPSIIVLFSLQFNFFHLMKRNIPVVFYDVDVTNVDCLDFVVEQSLHPLVSNHIFSCTHHLRGKLIPRTIPVFKVISLMVFRLARYSNSGLCNTISNSTSLSCPAATDTVSQYLVM